MNTHKSSYYFGLLALLFFFCSGCTERSTALKDETGEFPRAGSFSWVSSSVIFDTVLTKKPVSLLIFRNPGCTPCDSLERWTLTDSTVMGIIDAWFNACYIDASSDSLVVIFGSLLSCRAASEKFHVRSYPTTIAFNYSGRVELIFEGYYDPGLYADRLCKAYYLFKAK